MMNQKSSLTNKLPNDMTNLLNTNTNEKSALSEKNISLFENRICIGQNYKMKYKLLFFFPVFSALMMAAHFSRSDNLIMSIIALLLPLILFIRKEWVMRLYQILLLMGGLVWIERTIFLVKLRQRMNLPGFRLGVILGLVAAFTLGSILVFQNQKIRSIFTKDSE